MRKIVFLVLSLLLITGCSASYNLTINDDLTIREEAKLTGTDDFFSNYYKTTKKNVLKNILEGYKDVLKEKGYEYKLVEESVPFVEVSKKYDNIDNFTKNSILFNDYFDEVKYTENDNIKRIETIGFNENNPDNPERFDIKKLEISITCPYKVTNHNATSVNEEKNTFYYELNEKSDYKILLEFNSNKKFNPNEKTVIMVIICVVIIVLSWVIVYTLNKKKK